MRKITIYKNEDGDVVVSADGSQAVVVSLEANLAPRITNPGDFAYNEEDNVSIIVGIDPRDEDPLTLSATGLPSGLTATKLDNFRLLIAGTLPPGSAGTYTIQVSANDSYNPAHTDSFDIVVSAPSVIAPIFYNIGGGNYFAPGLYNAQSDPGPTGTSQVASRNNTIINDTDQEMYKTERFGDDFTYNIPVPNGNYTLLFHWAEQFFGAPNGNPSGGEGSRRFNMDLQGVQVLFNYDVYADAKLRAGSQTGHFYTVRKVFPVSVTTGFITIRLYNGTAGRAFLNGLLIVHDSIASAFGPIVDQPANRLTSEGENIDYQVSAISMGDLPLSYSATNLPTGKSIDASTGIISGTMSASASDDSPYNVQVTVNDGTNVPRNINFTWTVQDVVTNTPPTIQNPGAATATEGEAFSLQIVATDLETDQLTYSASGLPGGLTINPTTGRISGTPVAGTSNNTPFAVTVTVTDGVNTPISVTFPIAVDPAVVVPPNPVVGNVVHYVDFRKWPLGADYNRVLSKQDFPGHGAGATLDVGRHTIVVKNGSKCLRVTALGGEIGTDDAFFIPNYMLSSQATGFPKLEFEMRMMFDENYIPTKGGKIFTSITAGQEGAFVRPDGINSGGNFTLMWKQDMQVQHYIRHLDQVRDGYADDFLINDANGDPVYFPKGEWINVLHDLFIGDPDAYNAYMRTYIQGRLIGSTENLLMKKSGANFVGMSRQAFQFFFGGATGDWAPPSDQYAYIQWLKISVPSTPTITIPTSALPSLNASQRGAGSIIKLDGSSYGQKVNLNGWQGTEENPIIILGSHAQIAGIQLQNCRWVYIYDLASMNTPGANNWTLLSCQNVYLWRPYAENGSNGIMIKGTNGANPNSEIYIFDPIVRNVTIDGITVHAGAPGDGYPNNGSGFYLYNVDVENASDSIADFTSGTKARVYGLRGNGKVNIGHGWQDFVGHDMAVDGEIRIKNALDITLSRTSGTGDISLTVQGDPRPSPSEEPQNGANYSLAELKLFGSNKTVNNTVGATIATLLTDPIEPFEE